MGPAIFPASAASSFKATDVLTACHAAIEDGSGGPARSFSLHTEARNYAMVFLTIDHALRSLPHASDDEQGALAAAAAREILSELLPQASARLEGAARSALAALPGERARDIALIARTAGARVLAHRALDGWTEINEAMFVTAAAAYASADSSLATKTPWLGAQPFVLKHAAQFQPRLPYWRDFDGNPTADPLIQNAKILESVDRHVPVQTSAAIWSGAPVAAWNRVARQLAASACLDFRATVELLAAVNLAMADATLAALHQQTALARGNVVWREVWVATDAPPVPTDVVIDVHGTGDLTNFRADRRAGIEVPLRRYPAIPATVAGAAAAVLRAFPGAKNISFVLGDAQASRHYPDVTAAAREYTFLVTLDRRNSREACVAGYHFGEEIGSYVLKRLRAERR
jgi:hypothetical protein